jgi:hypothetical protein
VRPTLADASFGSSPYLRHDAATLLLLVYHLIYVSSAVNLFSHEELRELLEVSRRNNGPRGVTGLLLYIDGNFIQALEGERADVLDTHRRIANDPRHCGLITLLQGEVEKRDFSEWSMGFQRVDKNSGAAVPGYSDFLAQKADPEKQSSSALKLLSHFKSINR